MSNDSSAIYATPQAKTLKTTKIGIGSYIVNDYLLSVTEDPDGNGYLFTIKKGSQEQVIHLTELSEEAVNTAIEEGLREAKESGEFDGNGISSASFDPETSTITLYFTNGTHFTTESLKGDTGNGISSVSLNPDYTLTIKTTDGESCTVGPIRGERGNGIESVKLNPDYTLTIKTTDGDIYTTSSIRGIKGDTGNGINNVTFNDDYSITFTLTDGSTYKTESIRGEKGEVGNGISSATINDDYTLTLNFTDGTSYTTHSIRGAKGEQGEKGDPGESFELHICSSVEYDHETRIPTVARPRSNVLYLVPSDEGFNTDLFVEWVYIYNTWEKFGSASINLDAYAKKTDLETKIDKPESEGYKGQVLTSDGDGGQTWESLPTPDWNAANGTAGFIRNKPDLKAGTGTDSVNNRHSVASGTKSFAVGNNNTVSGENSFATGASNTVRASGATSNGSNNTIDNRASGSMASGTGNNVTGSNAIVGGNANTASGNNTFASGNGNTASGLNSSATGEKTTANHKSQNVFGEYNEIDQSTAASNARGNYIEIAGNGTAENARSNARTLDWSGNEWIRGTLKVGGESYDDPNAKELATKEYVDEEVAKIPKGEKGDKGDPGGMTAAVSGTVLSIY